MGAWYTIGILVGIGAAAGILTAALVPRFVVAALVAVAAGIAIGFLAFDWDEAVGGAAGGALGGLGATPVVAGALRRGGPGGRTAALVRAGGRVAARLALLPGLGDLGGAAVPGFVL